MKGELTVHTICFPLQGTQAQVVTLAEGKDLVVLQKAVKILGIPQGQPVVVLIGEASELPKEMGEPIRELLKGLAQVASKKKITLVDGGTDWEFMALMGQARAAVKGIFPLVGVAPAGCVIWPGGEVDPGEPVRLESYHTHYILPPGRHWGDGTETLFALVDVLAPKAWLTILIDGGDIALRAAKATVKANRPLVVIKESGRLADQIVAIIEKKKPLSKYPPLAEVIESKQVVIFDRKESVKPLIGEALAKMVWERLK